MTTLRLLVMAYVCANAPCAFADLILESDFDSNAFVTDFNELGLPAFNAPPVEIDGNLFSVASSALRYNAASAFNISGMTGENISTNTDLGFLEVEFSQPMFRAGAVFGAPQAAWSATVLFYDAQDTELASIDISDAGGQSQFVGWEDSALINRMRVVDTAANGFVTAMDDLRFQVVPEPSSFLCCMSLATVVLLRHRRKMRAG